MRILNKTSQYRRDFSAVLKCEGCDNTQDLSNGYDDAYYHQNVIPNIKCTNCNKSSKDLGETSTTKPDVPAHVVI